MSELALVTNQERAMAGSAETSQVGEESGSGATSRAGSCVAWV